MENEFDFIKNKLKPLTFKKMRLEVYLMIVHILII